MTSFNIIVAVDAKNGIGKSGNLPWSLPEDLKQFKEITSRTQDESKLNAVVMGRKTWDSIPPKFRPLPGRLNVVLTRDPKLTFSRQVIKAGNLPEALEILEEKKKQGSVESIFVIGGGQLFQEALNQLGCEKIYLTKINHDFQCDTFFPDFTKNYRKVSESAPFQEKNISYLFLEYLRK